RAVNVLIARDTTAAERTLAISYKPGDRVHFRKANKQLGIERGSYATVLSADAERSEITIRVDKGRTISYDPRKAAPSRFTKAGYLLSRPEIAFSSRRRPTTWA